MSYLCILFNFVRCFMSTALICRYEANRQNIKIINYVIIIFFERVGGMVGDAGVVVVTRNEGMLVSGYGGLYVFASGCCKHTMRVCLFRTNTHYIKLKNINFYIPVVHNCDDGSCGLRSINFPIYICGG